MPALSGKSRIIQKIVFIIGEEVIGLKDCPNKKENKRDCTCTYEPCERKGVCCQCIAYHRKNGEVPGCLK